MKYAFLCLALIVTLIYAKALDEPNQAKCRANGEWHFVITDAKTGYPQTITSELTDGVIKVSDVISVTKVTGNVAHYNSTRFITMTITSAWAQKPSGWNGEFNLSCSQPTNVELTSFSARPVSLWDWVCEQMGWK
jgi:hypothetical protein